MNSLRYIKDIVAKQKNRYVAGILCLLVVDALQLVFPRILGTAADRINTGALLGADLVRYSLIIAAIAVGIAVFRFLWRYSVLGASRAIEMELRNRFYGHLQKLDMNFYNNRKTGDLMAHATNDISNVTTAAGHGIILVIDSILIPVVAVAMMLGTAGVRLTAAVFLPLILLAFIITIFLKQMQIRVQDMQEAFSQLTETAREDFSGIRVIKSFVQEINQIRKFEKSNAHNRKMNLKFVRLISMLHPAVMSVSSLSFAIALWYGGILVINRQITLGDFVAFNSYLGMLVWPIAALGWIMSIFQRGKVSLGRINAIMDEKPGIMDSAAMSRITGISGKIELKNLTFSYPGARRPALRNISVTVEKGKTLAVVGRTGSGKTTLLNLILRLYNVEEGMLLIDDIHINRIPLQVLRSNIAYVPQDTFLFSTTIRENMDFFGFRDENSIIEASHTAGIYNDIMDFPDKFDTLVGERGVTLSGGQKQRIAIARAILRSPSILILDDCLSAVDTGTEEKILKSLKQIMSDRTSIIVSHRISAVRDADEIIVLEEGEIVERGTHESLLAYGGIYSSLYHKQLLAEQIDRMD